MVEALRSLVKVTVVVLHVRTFVIRVHRFQLCVCLASQVARTILGYQKVLFLLRGDVLLENTPSLELLHEVVLILRWHARIRHGKVVGVLA